MAMPRHGKTALLWLTDMRVKKSRPEIEGYFGKIFTVGVQIRTYCGWLYLY
jgi:hypothetical protein